MVFKDVSDNKILKMVPRQDPHIVRLSIADLLSPSGPTVPLIVPENFVWLRIHGSLNKVAFLVVINEDVAFVNVLFLLVATSDIALKIIGRNPQVEIDVVPELSSDARFSLNNLNRVNLDKAMPIPSSEFQTIAHDFSASSS